MAQHVARVLADLFDRLADAHAALAVWVVGEAPGAAAAGVDLSFHHIDGTAQLAGDVLCFFRRVGDAPLRSRNTVFGEERLRLIFVNVHEASKISLFGREERRLGQARRQLESPGESNPPASQSCLERRLCDVQRRRR